MVTEAIKKLIENYLTLIIWFMVHQDDKDISAEQFETVLQEIGRVEDQLKVHGVSQLAVDKLLDYARQIYEAPIDQLSENAQLRMCKIIFGAETHWANDPLPPKQSLGERKN